MTAGRVQSQETCSRFTVLSEVDSEPEPEHCPRLEGRRDMIQMMKQTSLSVSNHQAASECDRTAFVNS